ncbi:MAG: hypothetical protein QM699_10365 [Amaricoccus sp.]|uniref:hypothetical protein n=1 Tax=Amaricoccus sp. TaxID=1872485 RepID=UPI0039E38102
MPDDFIRTGTGGDVSDAFVALAAELARAEATVAELDELAGALVAGGAGETAALGLQGLDRLRQTLGDLAAYAGSLAGSATGIGDLARALGTVRSGDVAARLAGSEAPPGTDELWDF